MATALMHNRIFSRGPKLPKFTYDGEYALVEENGGWKSHFLTTGTLVPAEKLIVDIFAVGGGGGGNYYYDTEGGGGGAGGYTPLLSGVTLEAGKDYLVTIGAGGAVGKEGGATSFADLITANGGKAGGNHYQSTKQSKGGNGGSGGGSGGYSKGGKGGSDGSNGAAADYAGGTGQKTTTREFHEETGALYSGGGGGGAYNNKTPGAGGDGGGGNGGNNSAATAGEENTGGGGGGGGGTTNLRGGAAGGSGIVIIRNAREVA